MNDEEGMIKITDKNIRPEIAYWNSTLVCYILGVKPPFHIVDGFIIRVWEKYGVEKIVMMENGVFVVQFRSVEANYV